MAERKEPLLNFGSVSPLFNKMDALLARHRGPATPEDIPVLTEEASVMKIPTLTDEVRHDHTVMAIKPQPADEGLMFHPAEFAWLNPNPQPAEEKQADPPLVEVPLFSAAPPEPKLDLPPEPVFLDLPTLNLDALKPEEPEASEPVFELEIDAPEAEEPLAELEREAQQTSAQPDEAAPAIEEPEAADTVSAEENAPSAPAVIQNAAASAEEHAAHADHATVVAELAAAVKSAEARFGEDESLTLSMRTMIPEEYLIDLDALADESDFSLPQFEPEPLPAAMLEPAKSIAPTEEIEIIEAIATGETVEAVEALEMPESIEVVEAAAETPEAIDMLENIEMIEALEAIQATEAPVTPAPTHLDAATIDDITAHVGAHIAVDITTEVAQLARQHFTRIMNGYYQQALQQLTEEISRDLEAQLAPRIVELVRQELRDRGLIER